LIDKRIQHSKGKGSTPSKKKVMKNYKNVDIKNSVQLVKTIILSFFTVLNNCKNSFIQTIKKALKI